LAVLGAAAPVRGSDSTLFLAQAIFNPPRRLAELGVCDAKNIDQWGVEFAAKKKLSRFPSRRSVATRKAVGSFADHFSNSYFWRETLNFGENFWTIFFEIKCRESSSALTFLEKNE
jgi:hypothetical protein